MAEQDAFLEWVERHALTFGLHTDEEKKTLLAWREVFQAAGYSSADLHESTTFLAANAGALGQSEARFAGKLAMHLDAIQRRINDRRAVQYRRETDEHEHALGTCTDCSGSGRIFVPHIRGVVDGQWVPIKVARGGSSFYRMAVLCHCGLGRWVGSRIADEKNRPMTLEQYEARNPHWRRQLQARHQEQRAKARLSDEHS